jgi:uncharacterized protein (DUF3820 family)
MDVMPIGRYRGVPLAKVPRAYLSWLVRQPSVRPDLRVAIKKRLGIVTVAAAMPPVTDFKAAAAGDCE